MTDSLWSQHDIQAKVLEILKSAKPHDNAFHFGSLFLSAYQIAIKFKELYHADAKKIQPNVGGKDSGSHNSLAQYLARELSRVCKKAAENEDKIGIEGAYLSNIYLKELIYMDGTNEIESQKYDLSIFRYNAEY